VPSVEGGGVQPVETSDPEGVDYGWVMQTTFVLTILVGAPVVGLLSVRTTLPTWGARVEFAIRVGAVVWFLVAVGVFLYARRTDAGDGGETSDAVEGTDHGGGSSEAVEGTDHGGESSERSGAPAEE
jgi:hypothetical protein